MLSILYQVMWWPNNSDRYDKFHLLGKRSGGWASRGRQGREKRVSSQSGTNIRRCPLLGSRSACHKLLFHITFPNLKELILGIRICSQSVHHEGPMKKTAICLMAGEPYLRAKIDPLFLLPASDNVPARSQYLAPHCFGESKRGVSTNGNPFCVE